MPETFTIGNSFMQWIGCLEVYAWAIKIPSEALCDALLAFLDNATFRALDLLDLREETIGDFKQLTQALRNIFAPSTPPEHEVFIGAA